MEKLGIEPSLLLAQLVNFGLIMFVLTKLLYKPILKMLDDRKAKIEAGLKLADEMKAKEEKLKESANKLREEARKDAKTIIEEARKMAKDEALKIEAEAHASAEEIIEKGKAEALRARADMEKDVKNDSVELAVAMAKRLLANVMSEDVQHKLMEKHIHDLEKFQKA